MKVLPPKLEQAALPRPVRDVLARLGEGGFEAFLVGGCVRDLLLGKPPKDFDIATSALPGEVQGLFRRVIPTGLEHGTVTVLIEDHPVEVTTYRSESEYLDGRRPSKVVFRTSVTEDLARRDFTINAMAFNPLTMDFQDPFEGQEDLARGRVRCVGSALERFGEDGLRPLRGVRLATVLAFELDPETRAAIPATIPVFRKVAVERVREEFVKLLLSPGVTRGLELLQGTGLLAEFLPELETVPNLEQRWRSVPLAGPEEVARLTVLLEDLPNLRALLTRLKFPTKVIELTVLLAQSPVPIEPGATDAILRRWMSKVGRANVELALGIGVARQAAGFEQVASRVRQLAAQRPPLTVKDLALDGKALMAALRVPPSPIVGEVTRHLLDVVLENPALNTAEELSRLAQAWVVKQARGQ